jgi:hypothetical protein
LTVIPPELVKVPPAYRSPLESKTRVPTEPELIPVLNALHDVPFQRATLLTAIPSEFANDPAAYKTPLESKAIAKTVDEAVLIPPPTEVHAEPFHFAILFAPPPSAVVNMPPA